MSRGRYYLGRVQKLGDLDQERLLEAISNTNPISIGQFRWSFTDTVRVKERASDYLFSRLSKYSQVGHVTVVDESDKSQKEVIEENLLISSSPFVYLPEFSGIAYMHVWNSINEHVFRRRFGKIVEGYFDDFFVKCEIDPVSDYSKFVMKLRSLASLTEIHAKVHPPNPLFGDLWKDLHEYIKTRNAQEVQVTEKSSESAGINTELISMIDGIVDGQIAGQPTASITDAALLMAADGYGTGKVVGTSEENEKVVIRTSDTQKSFLYDKEPTHEGLANIAQKHFETVSEEREMSH